MNKILSHKAHYFYTPKKYPNLEFHYRTLSYRELNSLDLLKKEGKYQQVLVKACELAIISIKDLYNNQIDISALPIDLIKEVGSNIIDLSEVTEEQLDKLSETIIIYFDKQFKNKTWKCEFCQKKRLDRVRNCGYRNELDKRKDFKVVVGDRVYTSCPIYFVDREILTEGIECYNAFEKGLLPDDGGLYDQTKFFYISSFMLHQKIQEEEQKELKEMEQKAKLNS